MIGRRWLLGATLLVANLLASACGGGSSAPVVQEVTPSQPINRVDIVSATPPDGTYLSAGSTVTFQVAFTYELVTGDTASIQMILADQVYRVLNPQGEMPPMVSATRGKGGATLSYTLTVPAAGVTAITANFPMFVETSTRSQLMANVRYYVR